MEDWEKRAILDFHHANPLEGYRHLTFMMLDRDIVAVSPSSVYRVLREAGVMDRFNGKKSKKGTGFAQPSKPHDHWHVDISYLNICVTFFFMCSVLDGCSRSIVHWEIREKKEESDVEVILQKAREKHPDAKPRIITVRSKAIAFVRDTSSPLKMLVASLASTFSITTRYDFTAQWATSPRTRN